MFEDSVAAIPSLWASMNSWFTPAVLFLLLNLVIGTIAFTSTLANQNKHHNYQQQQHSQYHSDLHHHHHPQQQPIKLARSPSLLQRVRSINFYSYRSQEPNLFTTTAAAAAGTASVDHFNLTSDSDALFNLEHTQKPETHENLSHYSYDQPRKENGPSDGDLQFSYFQQNHQENVQQVNTQYSFEQSQEEKAQESAGTINTVTSVNEFGFGNENRENHREGEEEAAAYDGEDGDEPQSLDEVYSKLTGNHVSRTKSDTEPAAGEVLTKLPTKMRKSASVKSAFGHFEAEEIVEARRPATVRERGVAKVAEADEGVDAKADDFINKFKQQLKLQRLDSIIRYKEMITRGSGK